MLKYTVMTIDRFDYFALNLEPENFFDGPIKLGGTEIETDLSFKEYQADEPDLELPSY
jgi:hypothetical protein